MFYRGHIFVRILLVFVLIGLLFSGGYALYRAGFNQGYAQGAVVAAGEGQNPAPYMPAYPPYGYMYPPFHYGFFPFFPIFGIILFGFLFFALFGAIFRSRRWGYPHGSGYPEHWRGEAGAWGPPPWGGEQPGPKSGQSPSEEKSDKQTGEY